MDQPFFRRWKCYFSLSLSLSLSLSRLGSHVSHVFHLFTFNHTFSISWFLRPVLRIIMFHLRHHHRHFDECSLLLTHTNRRRRRRQRKSFSLFHSLLEEEEKLKENLRKRWWWWWWWWKVVWTANIFNVKRKNCVSIFHVPLLSECKMQKANYLPLKSNENENEKKRQKKKKKFKNVNWKFKFCQMPKQENKLPSPSTLNASTQMTHIPFCV